MFTYACNRSTGPRKYLLDLKWDTMRRIILDLINKPLGNSHNYRANGTRPSHRLPVYFDSCHLDSKKVELVC